MPFRPSPAALGQRKASGAWLSRQQRDPYVKGRGVYRSRSAFKLLEIERAHAVLAPRWVRTVVDLGAAPGGWSQAVAEVFGFRDGEAEHDGEGKELHDVDVSPPPPPPADPTARTILALDLLPIAHIAGVHTLQADFLAPGAAPALAALLHARRADVLLSDMAPNATGQRATDVEGALDLAKAVFRFARTHLACASGAHPGGTLVMKHFAHPLLDTFHKAALAPCFRRVQVVKPRASRADSAEAYWLCRGFKGAEHVGDDVLDGL